jgi:radical SAM protein (TIGR01212 family)
MIRIPFATGFSCPNRDGTKGFGGCVFCTPAGGGMNAQRVVPSIAEQYKSAKEKLAHKWPNAGHIAYLQSFSNTYAPPGRVENVIEQLLGINSIDAVIIATRADCIDESMADLLYQKAKRIPIEVELGLQTIHDETALPLNRCHTYREFISGYDLLAERGIRTCIHIINSLPGETRQMMLETAKEAGKLRPAGVKFHMLNIVKASALADRYETKPFPLMERDEYISLVSDQIELMPPETVICRLCGDAPDVELVAPRWTRKKLTIINDIDKEIYNRDSWQGKRFE